MDILRLEFVEQGYRYCTVSQCCEETYSPIGLVPGTDSDFVAFDYTAFFEKQLHTPDAGCYIPVGERRAFEIGKGVPLPVGPETALEYLID